MVILGRAPRSAVNLAPPLVGRNYVCVTRIMQLVGPDRLAFGGGKKGSLELLAWWLGRTVICIILGEEIR